MCRGTLVLQNKWWPPNFTVDEELLLCVNVLQVLTQTHLPVAVVCMQKLLKRLCFTFAQLNGVRVSPSVSVSPCPSASCLNLHVFTSRPGGDATLVFSHQTRLNTHPGFISGQSTSPKTRPLIHSSTTRLKMTYVSNVTSLILNDPDFPPCVLSLCSPANAACSCSLPSVCS